MPNRTVMKNTVFIPVCIVLFAGYLQAFSYFKFRFSGVEQLKMKNARLEQSVNRANFKTELALFQLSDYQQHVATLIPRSGRRFEKSPQGRELRGIASIAAGGLSSQISIDSSATLFEKARTAFAAKDYAASKPALESLVAKFPNSGNVPEAYFLLVESRFQTKDYEGTVNAIDTMVSIFPENDLTGYALIRLAKIYDLQDRPDDAREIYSAILKSYNDKGLQQQARSLMKAAKL
jgi:TolA-binding protein